MRRDARLAFYREGFPGFCHRQQLQPLIFVLGMVRKRMALAGMAAVGSRPVKDMIPVPELRILAAAPEDENSTPQIVGHAAPPLLVRGVASVRLVNKA